ncbi:NfeD family protein [Neobittarella massiliensis]|uniref:NfeD family protein n=2 Tax=Oscillospiraceae TaxID=216572 RepID=A0A8J6M208_9FIRM|nr:NfeD family protein [Neobittarella massiliensis]MBC3516931.1 NfeD family protein [Neobittarella massiliensis]SCJ82017.1 NfeD-like C-terminal%2C partner-binding [uncultured Anaerotruncus sp.]
MNYYAIGWLAAIVVFALLEAASPALVSIWFAAGAVGALLTSLFSSLFWVQLLVFFALSGILLAATRPLCRRYMKGRSQPTNADMLIGQTATVTEDISNVKAAGRVYLSGQSWAARSLDGSDIPKSTLVRVDHIEGVKLLVSPVQK